MNSKGEIFNYIENRYGYTLEELISKIKTRKLSNVRQVAMFLLKARLGWSFHKIGNLFKRDHSTAHHAYHKVTGLILDQKITFQDIDVTKLNKKVIIQGVDKSIHDAFERIQMRLKWAFEKDSFKATIALVKMLDDLEGKDEKPKDT